MILQKKNHFTLLLVVTAKEARAMLLSYVTKHTKLCLTKECARYKCTLCGNSISFRTLRDRCDNDEPALLIDHKKSSCAIAKEVYPTLKMARSDLDGHGVRIKELLRQFDLLMDARKKTKPFIPDFWKKAPMAKMEQLIDGLDKASSDWRPDDDFDKSDYETAGHYVIY